MVYKTKGKRGMKKKSQSIRKVVKQVLFNNTESKFLDSSNTDTSWINTDDTIFNQPNLQIPQGDGEGERIGNNVYIKGCKMNFLMTTSVSASNRLILIQTNLKDSSHTQVSVDWDASNVGVNGFYPRDTEYKYKVLMDKIINIDPDKNGSLQFSRYFKINKEISYVDGTTQLPNSFELILLHYTNNSTISVLTLQTDCRLFFKDI